MEACYEYLGCDPKAGVTYGRSGRGWEVEGTLCNHFVIRLVRERHPGRKADACRRAGCIYSRAAQGLVRI